MNIKNITIMKTFIKIAIACALVLLQSITYAQTSEVTYYIPDALGSPVAAMDEQGNIKWRKHYQPYGEEIEQDEASKDNHIGYTGHAHDRNTGLTYMGARYYDPAIGRFMGMDPADVKPGDPRTFNRFAYANNNPYKYIDPDGRAPKLSDLKKALKEVHDKLGGKLPKQSGGGKFGSSQHGDAEKGYRLDLEGHPNAKAGTPDADGAHINWWDFSKMKSKTAKKLGKENEVSGAVRVGDTAKNAAISILGGVIIGVQFMEEKMPQTTKLLEFLSDPVGTLSTAQEPKIHYD